MCQETVNIVEVGKCLDCEMQVMEVDAKKNKKLIERYSVNAVPSIVIDGKIKVVGVPNFPWFCGEEFYKMLEAKYPLKRI